MLQAFEGSSRGVPEWDWGPYFPGGTVQAKVIDAALADRMAFWAAVGHPNAVKVSKPRLAVAHCGHTRLTSSAKPGC